MALIKPDFCHNDCEVWLELDESLSIAEICKLATTPKLPTKVPTIKDQKSMFTP
jgi:hypothetical protein